MLFRSTVGLGEPEGTTLEQAQATLARHRIEKLPVVAIKATRSGSFSWSADNTADGPGGKQVVHRVVQRPDQRITTAGFAIFAGQAQRDQRRGGGETEQHIEAFIPPLAPDEPPFVTVVDHRDAPGSTREAVILCQTAQVAETDTHLVELPAAEASEVEIQVGQARIGLRARNSSATP